MAHAVPLPLPTTSTAVEESKTVTATEAAVAASGVMVDNVPVFAPGKGVDEFRVYHRADDAAASEWDSTVLRHYRDMRTHQTVEFVDRMLDKYGKFDHGVMTIREAFDRLTGYVDSSDPDTELPNLVHMLQTAERARASGEPDWMQLVCLVHDIGKIMFLWGRAEDGQMGTAVGPQWALGGDTWVVGCRIPDVTVYPELNALNPDMKHEVYGTENGVYEPGCGIMNLKFAFGHDEYGYMLLKHNGCTIPEEGLAMMRLHSCYPWHRGGAYRQFMAPGDDKLLEAVLRFNQYDLYSKSDGSIDVDAVWPYYQSLIDKYMPDGGRLRW